MKNMRIGMMAFAIALAFSAQADDIGEGNSGLAIPPKPAASDGQIVVYENAETGRLSPQNGVCGAPRRPGTANYTAWKAAAFPYSRTHDMNTCLTYGASLADATFHMTDRDLVHTAYDPEPNADGSVDVMMYPCSFVLVETKPRVAVQHGGL